MKNQPRDLNHTWLVDRKWCRFTNAPKKFRGLPQIWGAKKNFWPLFSRLPHTTPHISGTKRRIDKPKCLCPSTMCLLKVRLLSVTFDQADLLSVTFDPETAFCDPSFGGHYVATSLVIIVIIRLEDRLPPNIGFTLWRDLAVFAHNSAESVPIWMKSGALWVRWGWPWQILGTICAE